MEPTVSLVPAGSLELFAVDLSDSPHSRASVAHSRFRFPRAMLTWEAFPHSHRIPAGKWGHRERNVVWLLGGVREVADEHAEHRIGIMRRRHGKYQLPWLCDSIRSQFHSQSF